VSVTINMPQMTANGLSENWLFRHSGDAHWQALCASVGVASASLVDDRAARLYPTFVAISARYSQPLSAVQENDAFDTAVELSHFGQSFFRSEVTFSNGHQRFAMEMLTAFAARDTADKNDLRKSTPSSALIYTSRALGQAPALLTSAKLLRKGQKTSHDLDGHTFELTQAERARSATHEPSPYFDFNGANLLYFAAYPTLTDTLERQIIVRESLAPDARDWALSTSTTARDVFYYRNLDIGKTLYARLRTFTRVEDRMFLHTTLVSSDDDLPIADVFTAKRVSAA
jgi:probable biosynthetic protein (TIGR04098 family)